MSRLRRLSRGFSNQTGTQPIGKRHCIITAAAALAASQLCHSALATSAAWSAAGSGSWVTGSNWTPAASPGLTSGNTTSTDTATFAEGISPTITVDSGRNIGNITFDTSAINYTLSGGSLVLTSGGEISIASTASNTNRTELISSPITLEGNYTFANLSSNTSSILNVNATITSAATSGTTTLTLSGTNTGTNDGGGAISNGAGTNVVALTENSSGTWVLTGNNTYTGTTMVSAGILQLNATGNNIGPVTIASGATFQENPGSGITADFSTTIGPLSGSGSLVYANGLSSAGIGTFTINETQNSSFSGSITPGNTANGEFDVFVKKGSGTLTLNGSNGALSLQRGLTIEAGGLTFAGNATLVLPKTASGRDIFTVDQAAALTLDDTTTNQANRLGPLDDSITLNGGTFSLLGSSSGNTTETITAHNGSSSAANGLILNAGADLVNVSAGMGEGAVLTINAGGLGRNPGASGVFQGTSLGSTAGANVANIIFTGASVPNNSATGAAGSNTTRGILAGDIVDSSGAYGIATYDTTNGVRALIPGTENTGSLTANANVDAVSTLTNSTVAINSLQLDTNGSISNAAGNLTVASGTILTTGASVSIGSGGGSILKSGNATTPTEFVIYNAPSSALTIGSTITGNMGLTVGGNVTNSQTTLTANNSSLTGNITINGGVLSIAAINNLGASTNPVALNNGGELQSTGSFTLGSGNITVGGTVAGSITSGDIDVSGTNTLTQGTGLVLGVGALTKSNTGTLVLGAANTYSGGTIIAAGSLLANNSTGSALGSEAIAVNNGGTLGGNGIIANGTNPLSVNGGGTITAGADGNHTATLTTGSQQWNAGGTFAVKINDTGNATSGPGTGNGAAGAAGGWDEIAMSGLTLNGLSGNATTFAVTLKSFGSNTPSTAVSDFSNTSNYVWQIGAITGTGLTSSATPVVLAQTDATGANVSADSAGFTLDTSNFVTANGSTGTFALEGVDVGGNDQLSIAYNAAPEPGTAMLLIGGAGPGFLGRRRRQSKRTQPMG